MNFKDMVRDDWDVFINTDEFADDHVLNGLPIKAVVQTPTYKERDAGTGVTYAVYQPVTGEALTVFCKTKDLPEIPTQGMAFNLDGVEYITDSVSDDKGILTLNLIRSLP